MHGAQGIENDPAKCIVADTGSQSYRHPKPM